MLQLLTRRSLAGLGWRPGPWRYWLLAVALPLAYAGPAYLAGWLSGLAPLRPDLMAWIADVLNTQLGLPAMPDWALVPVFVAAVMTLAMALNLAAATGEEIGWRGWLSLRCRSAGVRAGRRWRWARSGPRGTGRASCSTATTHPRRSGSVARCSR